MRYIWISTLLILFSCGKNDSILIDGNTPPPDSTIETVILENYVNKLYISLLGREPIANELMDGLALLGADAPVEDRLSLVSEIQNKEEYYSNLFDSFRQDYLNGIDTMEIHYNFIAVFEELIEFESEPLLLEVYNEELAKLQALYHISEDLKNNNINTIDAQMICVNNDVYDEINMGSENYVVSLFQNFLHRYPTLAELKASTIMVDGEQSSCFGVNGDSKSDFNAIFFNHDGYYEGQAMSVYNKLLFRFPDSEEASFLATDFKEHKSYKELQKELLISNEFIGLE